MRFLVPNGPLTPLGKTILTSGIGELAIVRVTLLLLLPLLVSTYTLPFDIQSESFHLRYFPYDHTTFRRIQTPIPVSHRYSVQVLWTAL